MTTFGSSDNIARPSGKEWNKRKVAVKARSRVCVYCGRVPVKPNIAHVIPLSEGLGLRMLTSDIGHPLNSLPNLAMSCDLCNLSAGSLSTNSARRKIAAKLGIPVYDGPLPDLTEVRLKLEALEAASRGAEPSKPAAEAQVPVIVVNSPTWRFRTVQAAMRLAKRPISQRAYDLIAEMIDAGAPCDQTCDCGGDIPGALGDGVCIDAAWDLNQMTRAAA